MRSPSIDRADFLKRLCTLSVLAVVDRPTIPALANALKHPEPREGITAEKVLKPEELGEQTRKSVLEAYDIARQYPQIFDGLACACGCLGTTGPLHRSLLVCYETRQPTGCHGCREQATFVARLAKNGKTLAEIRTAVDKEFD